MFVVQVTEQLGIGKRLAAEPRERAGSRDHLFGQRGDGARVALVGTIDVVQDVTQRPVARPLVDPGVDRIVLLFAELGRPWVRRFLTALRDRLEACDRARRAGGTRDP